MWPFFSFPRVIFHLSCESFLFFTFDVIESDKKFLYFSINLCRERMENVIQRIAEVRQQSIRHLLFILMFNPHISYINTCSYGFCSSCVCVFFSVLYLVLGRLSLGRPQQPTLHIYARTQRKSLPFFFACKSPDRTAHFTYLCILEVVPQHIP